MVLVQSHDIVVVVYFAYLLVKVMIFITQNGAPTQLIDAQCALQIWDDTIVAEEQSYRLMSSAGQN